MAEERILIIKLRGTNFPVKDSGIEGNAADPFYEIRKDYNLGSNPRMTYEGKHSKSEKALYKSEKIKQNLNPEWQQMAVDLKTLCGMDFQRKLLFDIYDWDRFSSPDFMSYVELSVDEILQKQGTDNAITLLPPGEDTKHKQNVGELFVVSAQLAFPQVHLTANANKKPTKGPSIHVTNSTTIPLKVRIGNSYEEYNAAQLGKPIGSPGDFIELDVDACAVLERQSKRADTYLFILSPNSTEIVLAKHGLGTYVEGSKTTALSLSLDLDAPDSAIYTLQSATAPPPGAEGGGGGGGAAGEGPAEGGGFAPAPSAAKSKGFKVTLSLKLRGNDLPIKDEGILGGKSDPYYEIRPAFGPGYVTPNHDVNGRPLATRVYAGKHSDKAFLKSDVVKNELNPRWKTHLLDLTELCHLNGRGGLVDLNKRVLIDVWDKDMNADDFMCYLEVSLQELVDAAESKAPLYLQAPPEGSKQSVGRLYVDKAVVGFPEVQVRDNRGAASPDGLKLTNKTPVLLQVVMAENLEQYNAAKVGVALHVIEQSRNTMISAGRDGTISRMLMQGSTSLYLMILNESNVVVGKKSLPSGPGARELYMDLESGSFAFSPNHVHEQLQTNYQEAVAKIGNVASDDVGLTDADIRFFKEQMKRSEELALLLPVFGLQGQEDTMGLASFEAYLERQTELLQREVLKCDLLSSEGDGVKREVELLKKLHMIDQQCDPQMKLYGEMQEALHSQMDRLHDDSVQALQDLRVDTAVKGLSVLQAASSSELTKHLADPDYIASKYQSLVAKLKEHLESLKSSLVALSARNSTAPTGFSDEEAENVKAALSGLIQSGQADWQGHLDPSWVGPIVEAGKGAVGAYVDKLLAGGQELLAGAGDGKLGRSKGFVDEASLLCGLPAMEGNASERFDAFYAKAVELFQKTQTEVEGLLREVAVFCGTGWKTPVPGVVHPTLMTRMPRMVDELVGAEWMKNAAGGQYAKGLEAAKTAIGQSAQVMVNQARAAASSGLEEAVHKVLYVSAQIEVLAEIGEKHEPRFDKFAKEVEDLGDMLERFAASVDGQVKQVFPWHATEDADVFTLVSVDVGQAGRVLDGIHALVAYVNRKGLSGMFDEVQGLFNKCMERVFAAIKAEIDTSFQSDGEVSNIDQLRMCLRAGSTIKKDYPSLYRLAGSDFMARALQKLSDVYGNLERGLTLNKSDANKSDELLQVVRRLCVLDDAIEDEAKKFTALFQQYEESLKQRVSEVVQDILQKIEESNFVAVDELLEKENLKANVPWQVKAELSNKIELSMEAVAKKVRELSKELSVSDLEAIAKELKALSKAASVIQSGVARPDVQKEYERLIGGGNGGLVKTQLLEKVLASQQDVDQLLKTEQFPKAVATITNIEQSWPVLESLLGEQLSAQQPSVKDHVKEKLQQAVGESMEKFKALAVEQYQFQPPSDFFNLFAGMPQFEPLLDDLWRSVEQNIAQKIQNSFLGEGSKELEMLTQVIEALPDDKPGKAVLRRNVQEGTSSAQGEMSSFNSAVESRDAEAIIMLSKKSPPSTQKQLWEALEDKLDAIRKEFCQQLEKSPTTYMFDRDFTVAWTFVAEIEKELPEAEALQYKIKKIYGAAQASLRSAEFDAASTMSCLVDGRVVSGGDDRFKDLDSCSEFLQRLVTLKCDHDGKTVGNAIFPNDPNNQADRFGNRCRSTLRDLVDDFKKTLKELNQLLKTDAPEKAFEISKILACLKLIKARAMVYFDAKEMLGKLDGVLGVDSWKSVSIASTPAKAAARGAEYEPASWGQIAERVRKWVVEHFKPQPDMMVKIKISSDRVQFFQLIGRKAAAAESLVKLEEVLGSDGDVGAVLKGDYQAKVTGALSTVWAELNKHVDALKNEQIDPAKFSDDAYSNKQDNDFQQTKARFDEVNRLYGAVSLYKEHIAGSMQGNDAEAMDLDTLSDVLLQRVVNMADKVEKLGTDLDGVSGMLMCMHSQAEELLFQAADCKKVVASALEKFQSAEATKAMGISKLAVKLRHARMRPAGEAVVRGYDAFQGYLTQVFNQKTQSQDINYVLQNIKLDANQFNSSTAGSNYAEFDKEYKQRVDELLTGGLTETQLVSMIKNIVAGLHISHAPGCVMWTVDMKRAMPKLVALVFAVWTLHHSKRFLKAMDSTDKKAFLFMPHPVQVVAIFALLGMDSTREGLERSLVQVRTGEGKSAVLGVTASVFALFQCRVYCACYSEYLSQRDGASMEFLFKALGILEDVKYMTLSQVCEYEVNKQVNIREELEALITGSGGGGGAANVKSSGPRKPRVLLVDEVDVFFSKDFYGSAYVPACALRHSSISDLIREIYKTGIPLTMATVKTWTTYSNVTSVLKGWDFLVDAAVEELLQCMETFAEDVVENEYIVKDDKIGYKEQDSIAFNISYGYTTLLAYLKENQKGNISEHSLARNLKFNVRCGSFSYAKLPRDFDLVMGVTGTLETMSEEERRIVKEEYDIKKLVYMPSVYGHNQVQTRRITAARNKDEFVKTLVEEIETHRKNRAAIVFFDSSMELRDFSKQPQFEHGNDASYLLEEIYPEEKDQIVKIRAAQIDAITLATKPFGRGTDFQCMDDTVQQHGGIHIIQTFVAETLSEEIQIKGRTARQGEKGSWSMVLMQSEVTERYGIPGPELDGILSGGESDESRKALWGLLNKKRLEVCETELQEMVKEVVLNAKVHEAALKFTESLMKGDVDPIKKHLEAQIRSAAAGPGMQGKARIMVLLDATGSMGRMMDAAKDTVGLMFDRAGEIIKEHLGDATEQFEMQFAVYRNYSSGPGKLLEASAWKSDPAALRQFLGSTKCSGGQGNEAVEIAFWHANQEQDVKQIVIIADAMGNTPAEVEQKRRGIGERQFAGTRFEVKTTVDKELALLKEKKIPVDAFHLVANSNLKRYYDQITEATGGTNQYLNVQKPEGRELFIGHITTAILQHVGGEGKGADLVGAYMRKFGGGKMHS